MGQPLPLRPEPKCPGIIGADSSYEKSVRVLFLTNRPASKTPLYQHEVDRVMIYLDPIRLVLRNQNGEIDRQTFEKGLV
jgi:hypothetical protein